MRQESKLISKYKGPPLLYVTDLGDIGSGKITEDPLKIFLRPGMIKGTFYFGERTSQKVRAYVLEQFEHFELEI
jgi:hypothetical protein